MTSTVLRQHDLELGHGRRLRLTLVQAESGNVLVLAPGFGEGERFHRPSWSDQPLTLPASALPELVAALQALEGKP